ncbi:hypothetical protein WJX84_000257 [Apatococcus fuscideae]|uniref:Sulfate-binding protein n=1 Tax=Apatococcus fuscideae TaxID=2026836 RepID=A0AAW1T866_9CHLO
MTCLSSVVHTFFEPKSAPCPAHTCGLWGRTPAVTKQLCLPREDTVLSVNRLKLCISPPARYSPQSTFGCSRTRKFSGTQLSAPAEDPAPEQTRKRRRKVPSTKKLRRQKAQQRRTLLGAVGLAGFAFWLRTSIISAGAGGGHGGGKGHGSSGGGGSGGGGSDPSAIMGDLAKQNEDRKGRKKKATVSLTLVSFAVTRQAYQRITERFAREYEEATGQPVRFRLSFGSSGTQARAVCDGLPADIVALALPLDIMRIEDSGLINPGWRQRAPNNAVVSESVVSIVYRNGNPKKIRGWEDLTRSDVDVITANPKTAGVARWNFLALWGHKAGQGNAVAQEYVTQVFDRVQIQPRDAREASDVFYKQGQGDALLNYENEVIFTNKTYGDDRLPYISPDNNVQVEMPVALVDKNLVRNSAAARAAASSFLQYLWEPACQQDFADCGFRPVSKEVLSKMSFPKVKNVWSVDGKLGGWDQLQQKFFDDKGVLDQIQGYIGAKRLAERRKK